MPPLHRRIPTRPLAIVLLAATGACAPDLPTVAPAGFERSAGDPAAARANRIRITSLSLASTTLMIGGAATTYTVTIRNTNGEASGVSVQAEIVQGTVVAQAGGTAANCVTSSPGLVPKGACTFSFTTSASNTTVSGGTLVPGPATFVLHLNQSDGATTTELDNRSVGITLVDAPYIASTSFDGQTQPISLWFGTTTNYTIVIENPTGNTLTNTLVQAEYIQVRNGVTYGGGGGGGPVECSPGVFDQLPPGTCTMPFSTTPAANPPNGLDEGIATFYIRLYIGGTLVSTKSYSVYLSYPIG